MKKGDRIDEIYEVVSFIKNQMVKGFADVEDRFVSLEDRFVSLEDRFVSLEKKVDLHHDEVIGKLDGVNRRIDNEVDKRKVLDVRASKLETKVFGK
jgi:hypothetical protein